MSKTVTIRDVPDDVGDELSARAAATGRSLQEYLRAHMIDLAQRVDPEVFVARLRQRKKLTGSSIKKKAILRHLRADRR